MAELREGQPLTTVLMGLHLDELLARYTDTDSQTALTDALGSILALAHDTQTPTTFYAYSPYGETQTTGEPDPNPTQYTARQNDPTGLYYYRARYYDPVLKRFISEDPIGLRGGGNVYGYVENDPINTLDPYGLRSYVDLGLWYEGGIDTFDVGGSASFEIHVYDPKGNEIGLFGPDGWFNKHGKQGRPDGIPDSVEAQCKGKAVDLGRRMGKIPSKGLSDISGNKWKSFFRAAPLFGPLIDATRPSPERACEIDPNAEFCQ